MKKVQSRFFSEKNKKEMNMLQFHFFTFFDFEKVKSILESEIWTF